MGGRGNAAKRYLFSGHVYAGEVEAFDRRKNSFERLADSLYASLAGSRANRDIGAL